MCSKRLRMKKIKFYKFALPFHKFEFHSKRNYLIQISLLDSTIQSFDLPLLAGDLLIINKRYLLSTNYSIISFRKFSPFDQSIRSPATGDDWRIWRTCGPRRRQEISRTRRVSCMRAISTVRKLRHFFFFHLPSESSCLAEKQQPRNRCARVKDDRELVFRVTHGRVILVPVVHTLLVFAGRLSSTCAIRERRRRAGGINHRSK